MSIVLFKSFKPLKSSKPFLFCCSALIMFCSQYLFAEVFIYPFENEIQETRFQSLLGELRCPKCQNQSLADSDADIAKDLRQKVYDLLLDGKSDDEIRNYLIDRYGDFITYRPPLKSSTALLWLGPLLLLLISILIAVVKVLPKSSASRVEKTDEQQSHLND